MVSVRDSLVKLASSRTNMSDLTSLMLLAIILERAIIEFLVHKCGGFMTLVEMVIGALPYLWGKL